MERPYQDKAILKTRARRTVQVRLPHSEGITHVPGGGEKRMVQDCTHVEQLTAEMASDTCVHAVWSCASPGLGVYRQKWQQLCSELPTQPSGSHGSSTFHRCLSFFFFWILTKCGRLLVGEELTFATGHCRITLGGHGEGAFSDYR